MTNRLLSQNTLAWENYCAEPHFEGGDRREDFDNGWDAALDQRDPSIRLAFDLLDAWEQSSAASEATDLADETLQFLQSWGLRRA